MINLFATKKNVITKSEESVNYAEIEPDKIVKWFISMPWRKEGGRRK